MNMFRTIRVITKNIMANIGLPLALAKHRPGIPPGRYTQEFPTLLLGDYFLFMRTVAGPLSFFFK
jgi:hypothetical protein